MGINPKTFVKRAPWAELKRLLVWCGVGPEVLDDIDPDGPRNAFADAILSSVEAAGREISDKFYAAVDQIEQLQDDFGFRSLRSVATMSGMSLGTFDAIEDLRAAAIEVLLASRRDFDRALASHFADRLRHGRSWSGFALGKEGEVKLREDTAARSAFEASAASLFSSDPLNGRCRFDWFERRVEDPSTGDAATCLQATIYVEERPRVEAQIADDGDVVNVTRRPVAEGAFIFDEKTGQVEIVAKGGRPLHQRMAKAYAETMVEGGGESTPVRMRMLDLRSLADDRDFALQAEDGVLSVRVEKLTVAAPNDGFVVTLAARPSVVDDGSLHEMTDATFSSRSPLKSPGWRVVSASLRVFFRPETPDSRPKGLLVTLSLPNRTNLRDQTERHRLIAHKLLERWGLYAADDD